MTMDTMNTKSELETRRNKLVNELQRRRQQPLHLAKSTQWLNAEIAALNSQIAAL
jgi:hypothetical protein